MTSDVWNELEGKSKFFFREIVTSIFVLTGANIPLKEQNKVILEFHK